MRADVFTTVAEALAALEEGAQNPRYDLALLDMHLPDGSGLEVLARIRHRKMPLAVVVLTGSGDEESVLAALRAGADEYLAKRSEYWNQLEETLRAARAQFLAHPEQKGRPIRVAWAGGDASTPVQQARLAKQSPQFRILSLPDCESVLAAFREKSGEGFADVLLLEDAHAGLRALECLQTLKQEGPTTMPVLLAAATVDPAVALKALKAGAWDFLMKDGDFSARLPWALESSHYRFRAEKERWALRASESRLSAIFAAEPQGILVLDAAGTLLEVNPAGLEHLEAGGGYWKGRNLADFLVPEARVDFARLVSEAARGAAGAGSLEVQLRGLQGTLRWLELRTASLPGADGDSGGVLCLASDITQRKENEEKLRHSDKMSAFGQLAGGIAHDFNNQLAAILGYAEILTARLEKPSLRRYAESIELAARRSSELTKSLLTFARRTPTEHHPISLHALILETLAMLERTVDKRIALSRDLRAHSDKFLGDPSLMQNALLNLCLNARDAMPQGGRLTLATETVDWDGAGDPGPTWPDGGLQRLPPGRYLHLTVADTGSGMDAVTRQRLFEPFFTTKPVGKGTGMGLPSVLGTLGLHQGGLAFESEVGKGTVFHLYLPATELVEARTDPASAERPLSGLRILVVDDEPLLRELLVDMLADQGHRVRAEDNGRRAVEAFAEEGGAFDLVLLDWVMPEMGGAQAYEEMKRLKPDLRVLFSSGYAAWEDGASKPPGTVELIRKPYARSALEAAIRRVMG